MADELIVVVGIGQFGERVARTLAARGREVLVVDRSEEKIEEIKDVVPRAVRADSTEEAVMRAIGVAEASAAVLGMGELDFEPAILTVAVLKSLGVPRIVARASSETHGRILELVGASQIVYPERDTGDQIAWSLLGRGVRSWVGLHTGHAVAEVEARREWAGKSLADLSLRARYGVSVLAIRRRIPYVDGKGAPHVREENVDSPQPTDLVGEHDLVVVVGSRDAVEKLTLA